MNSYRSKRLHLWAAFIFLFFSAASAADNSGIYEARLPAQLASQADLCAYVPCGEVIAADAFSLRRGRPSYVEAYRVGEGGRTLVGYVFLSSDAVDIPAYSGKPIVTLIGMDTRGAIAGVKILSHSEPILLVGIPESALTRFVGQYVGKSVGDKIEVGAAREGYIGVDAISGATVTVIAQNQAILRAGYTVARQLGIFKAPQRPPAKLAAAAARDWAALVREGSVQRLYVRARDVGMSGAGDPYIDLHFGYLNAAGVGTSILGEAGYRRLMRDLAPGEHALFIVGTGSASFKGSGFVRGGIFDRIQVTQEMESFTFRDLDYLPLYRIHAAGAPAYRESGIFIVRGSGFNPAYPWSLVFLANRMDPQTGTKTFANFDREYWLPAPHIEGGRPAYERPAPPWLRVWQSRAYEIALFVTILSVAAAVYALRDRLVRRARHRDRRWVSLPKYFFWLVAVGFFGFYLMAQPSITQVLTWVRSLVFAWRWELFLSDPFIFVFWWFILASAILWGRGLFCGWLCPYGALSEFVHKAGRYIGLGRWQFAPPKALHDRLKWIKYLVFAALLGASFYSVGLAERMAEVEPFKTVFLVSLADRAWPYLLFLAVLLGLSSFMHRPFCKYLCPLGAALAIPTAFRLFGLKRKRECTTCKACATGCASLAIDARGRIDARECLLCLDCMILYYDAHACPPLAAERKRREKAAVPLTPIGADGYFLPIAQLEREFARRPANRRRS